jgi:glucose uptake protein GlcU
MENNKENKEYIIITIGIVIVAILSSLLMLIKTHNL